MIRTATACLVALMLASCTAPGSDGVTAPEWDDITAASERAWSEGSGWMPFSQGAVSVIAREDGRLKSRLLVPCRGGTAVCAGSLTGPAGEMRETRDHTIVTGLHGRVFYLAPGGDGTLGLPGGGTVPLVWGPVDRDFGPWVSARLGQGAAR